jgi:hypothetical protein
MRRKAIFVVLKNCFLRIPSSDLCASVVNYTPVMTQHELVTPRLRPERANVRDYFRCSTRIFVEIPPRT